MTQTRRRWLWLLAGGVAAAVLPYLGIGTFYTSLITEVWIFAIVAASLDLLLGYTGLISFAHGAIFGAGAYTVGIAYEQYGITGFWATLGLALLVAIGISAVFAVISLRTKGDAFIIITLALNQLVWGFAQQWTSLTGGDNGLVGWLRPQIGPFSTAGPVPFYYVALIALVVALGLLHLLVRSPFGLALVGVREEPTRMRALGYNPWLYKFLAFVIGGLFAGFAGLLFAYYNLYVSPVHVDLTTSTQFLLMVLLGGKATLLGPVLGAGLIVIVSNALSDITSRWQILLGGIYIAIVMYAMGGIVGVIRNLAERFRRRRSSPAALNREVEL